VDSSTISAVLAENIIPGSKLPAFSIVFEENIYSDSHLQQIMYNSFPLEPHNHQISSLEYWEILNKAMLNLDNPVNDDAVVGMFRVFALARSKGCTAVFDGEAADELFFTGHVHSERRYQKYLAVPFGVRKLLLGSLFTQRPIHSGFVKRGKRFLYNMGLSDTERRLLVLPSFYKTDWQIIKDIDLPKDRDALETARKYLQETRLHDPLNIYYYGLIKSFLPDDLLYKNERAASANGVINRTPFIDYRVVEAALKVPERYKVKKSDKKSDGTKIVYKKAIEGIIPDQILKRKKTRGFSIPSAEWFKGQLKDNVHDLIWGSQALYPNYLDSARVKELYTQYDRGVSGIDVHIRSILLFEIWLRNHVGKEFH
jgi:asparagine synthase (glutamine-hydrolysing)